ncbi:MAG TPA: hypothetical protein VMV84_05810 [Dehalococcoidales bacterium]|nr:hypothetical protein [Dehalococcoidales bacterium]
MLYRARIDLCFDKEDTARTILDGAKSVLSEAVRIAKQDKPTGEISFVEIHKCYHDEEPTRPCEIIERIEV